MALTRAAFHNWLRLQMAIPQETVAQLPQEGLDISDDLLDFGEDEIKALATSLMKPHDRIQNPDPGAAPGDMIPRPPYVFNAKSQKRLLAAHHLFKFYGEIGRDMDATAVTYSTVIRDFDLQWKGLCDREADTIEVPKLTKNLNVMKFIESFKDFLSRKVGARRIPSLLRDSD